MMISFFCFIYTQLQTPRPAYKSPKIMSWKKPLLIATIITINHHARLPRNAWSRKRVQYEPNIGLTVVSTLARVMSDWDLAGLT